MNMTQLKLNGLTVANYYDWRPGLIVTYCEKPAPNHPLAGGPCFVISDHSGHLTSVRSLAEVQELLWGEADNGSGWLRHELYGEDWVQVPQTKAKTYATLDLSLDDLLGD